MRKKWIKLFPLLIGAVIAYVPCKFTHLIFM